MKRLAIMAATIAGGLILGSAIAFAQSSSLLLPYGMSAGMQLFNRALQPRPAAGPTPVSPYASGEGVQAGDRRLVCEQWNGQRWVVIPVNARQCTP
jgi:hypothetical protein